MKIVSFSRVFGTVHTIEQLEWSIFPSSSDSPQCKEQHNNRFGFDAAKSSYIVWSWLHTGNISEAGVKIILQLDSVSGYLND